MDKISVIIPIYNVEKYLVRCLDSVFNQSYKNIEVLLIDDASTDGSSKIAIDYCNRHSDIFKYIKKEKNEGLAAARNTGIELSTGDWLSFIDSDDWVSLDFLESLLCTAIKHESNIVVCDYYYAWDEGKLIKQKSLEMVNNDSSHKEKVALIRNHSVTKLFRKSFILSTGLRFPQDIKRGEDMALIVPLLTLTDRISICDKPLYYYQRENSISNSNKKINLEFYDKIIKTINESISSGFEEEIEYRMILELVYGKTLLMVQDNYSNSEIKKHLMKFSMEYKSWRNNSYLRFCNKLKVFFILLARGYHIYLLKGLVRIRSVLN